MNSTGIVQNFKNNNKNVLTEHKQILDAHL